MDSTVVDNPRAHRFELLVDGDVAGYVTYQRSDSTLSLMHTEIDIKYEGHGLGSVLVRSVLDTARTSGVAVLPYCPFVRGYLKRHPEEADVVPADQRDRFDLTA
jgi:predicted GNAT family acetyltransferase